jgi:hypothetical protein
VTDAAYVPGVSAILDALPAAETLYYRLILVVVAPGRGDAPVLDAVRERTGWALVNLSLELSRSLVALTDRQRKLQAIRIMHDIVSHAAIAAPAGSGAERDKRPVLIDNIELLFDVSLALDPLRLLKEMSKSRTLVVGWPGEIAGGCLISARPGHPEHRSYPVEDLILVGPSVNPVVQS